MDENIGDVGRYEQVANTISKGYRLDMIRPEHGTSEKFSLVNWIRSEKNKAKEDKL